MSRNQTYPDKKFQECLRVSCELKAVLYTVDEYTDKLGKEGARTCADIVMDAVRNPHNERPQGESKLGEITRQYVYLTCANSLAVPLT